MSKPEITAFILALSVAIAGTQTANAADTTDAATPSESPSNVAVPTELRLSCTEQPSLRVVVGAEGEIASEQAPPAIDGSVSLRVVNLQHRTEGPAIPARIESDHESLTADAATWRPDTAVVADDGRLRLDLTDSRLYLLEPKLGNQGLFRRFDCRTADGAAEEVHYRCGPDFALWVRFQGQETADVRYSGGTLSLPRAISGSGARYEQNDNELWIKGDEALFRLSGSEQHRCQVAD